MSFFITTEVCKTCGAVPDLRYMRESDVTIAKCRCSGSDVRMEGHSFIPLIHHWNALQRGRVAATSPS